MRNKPRIRFKGFTEDWEQREFSNIFAEVKSGLSRMLSNDDIGLPVVRANNINDGQLNLVDDIKYWYKNDPQGANTNNYLIEQGDILINFINSEAKMGTAAYVTRRPERDTIYTTNILRCKVNDEYNPYFIYSLTFLNSYKNYITSITKPAVNQASFTTVDFKKYSIKIPTVKEQNQIADLIETFNKLITLHQRKLEKLKLAKKALLQKLFPKNGSKFPELRFKGFADAWEQRKLIDIAKTFIGLVTTMTENYRDSGTLLIRNSDIKEGQFVFSEKPIHLDEEFAEKNKTRRLQIGDVVTVHTGDIGTSAVIQEKEAGAIGFATINTRTDKRILNPYFLSTYFNTEKHKCYANSVSTGDGRSNYNIKDFNKLVISIPTLDEQEKISVLINNINTIITLHQRKLDKLQEVKKGLLQKMFV